MAVPRRLRPRLPSGRGKRSEEHTSLAIWRCGSLMGLTERTESGPPHEFLEVEIRWPYHVGFGHDYPAAGEKDRKSTRLLRSGGVEASWVSQNGQKVVPRTNFLKWKSDGRTTSASATITQRPVKKIGRAHVSCDLAVWKPHGSHRTDRKWSPARIS